MVFLQPTGTHEVEIPLLCNASHGLAYLLNRVYKLPARTAQYDIWLALVSLESSPPIHGWV
jgi:hypothetical protein